MWEIFIFLPVYSIVQYNIKLQLVFVVLDVISNNFFTICINTYKMHMLLLIWGGTCWVQSPTCPNYSLQSHTS